MSKQGKYGLNGILPEHVGVMLVKLQDVAKYEDVPLSHVIDTWRTLELSYAAVMLDRQMTELNGNLSSIDQSICDRLVRIERAVLGLIS